MNFGPNYDGQDPKIDVELDQKLMMVTFSLLI